MQTWLLLAPVQRELPRQRNYGRSGRILCSSKHRTESAAALPRKTWLPRNAYEDFANYWDEQFTALNEAADGRDLLSVFDVIDNDDRWTPYFHTFSAQDFTRNVDRASVEDTLAYVRQENDHAVATGFDNLVARYGSDVPVSLNSAVHRIDWSGRDIKLHTTKGTVRAQKVILTVSTGVLATHEIEFSPALPGWKLDAVKGITLASSTRVALMFDTPLLQELRAAFTARTHGDDPLDFRPFLEGNRLVRSRKERPRSLKCFARVLMFQNTHYLHTLRLDTVVDRMRAAHAAVITRSNMVNRWIELRLLCQYGKSLFELVTISVRLQNPELFITVLCDSHQVILGALRKTILTHASPCGVAARPPISRRRCDR